MKLKAVSLCAILALASITSVQSSTLKDKVIKYPAGSYLAGQLIPLGVDLYGYNYQAHSFAGSYFNSYANKDGFPPYNGDDAAYVAANPTVVNHWAWPYRADQLSMKWNEAWLSNQDQDGDGLLDRHYGFPGYIGSGAWLNNHQDGTYTLNGEDVNWNYFVKIVAVPADATLGGPTPEAATAAATTGTTWFDSSGKEIGPVIWGEFATIQEVYNDPGTGAHGVSFHSPAGPGLGKY